MFAIQRGETYSVDFTHFLQLYKNVCERGRWSSMFELAYKQYRAGRVDSSLATYMLLAELGYEVAQSNAAYILDQGIFLFFRFSLWFYAKLASGSVNAPKFWHLLDGNLLCLDTITPARENYCEQL